MPDGWVSVQVRAAALNHHDVWSLRGVGLPADRLPMILGCDAAGVAPDGREVIVYAVINDPGFTGTDATYDPRRSLLSERYPGTFAAHGPGAGRQSDRQAGRAQLRRGGLPADRLADRVPDAVHRLRSPARGHRAGSGSRRGSRHRPGGPGPARRVAGLGHLAGRAGAPRGPSRWVPTRSFATGARLPERVDAVMDTVGAATWSHSINALRPGGTLVISGTTSGAEPAQGRADQDLLQAAPGDRLHHGHPGRADVARPDARRRPAPGR